MRGLRPEADHWIQGLAEPDTMLPAQYFAKRVIRTGEQRLMAAILEDAAHVYRRGFGRRLTSRERHRYREAVVWLDSNDREWVFSFVNVCETLGMNPIAVREKLHADVAPRRPAAGGVALPLAVGA